MIKQNEAEGLLDGINESQDEHNEEGELESVPVSEGKNWDDWLCAGQFYIFGGVYMFSRIAMNANAVFIPLYIALLTTGGEEGESDTSLLVAVVPLISYLASLLWSLFGQNHVNRTFSNRLIPLIMAIFITIIGSIPFIYMLENPGSVNPWVYPIVAVQGVGIALMLNTAVSLISDVIGTDNKSSAFVYGVYSLLDKFANGFLLWWLVRNYSKNVTALKYILAMIPSISALGCALLTWIGLRMYAEKLAKISVGSVLKEKKKTDGDDVPIYDRKGLLENHQE